MILGRDREGVGQEGRGLGGVKVREIIIRICYVRRDLFLINRMGESYTGFHFCSEL